MEAWMAGPGGDRDCIIGWKEVSGRGVHPSSQGDGRRGGAARREGGGSVEKKSRFLGKGHQAWLSRVVTWAGLGRFRARTISARNMVFMLLTFSTRTWTMRSGRIACIHQAAKGVA